MSSEFILILKENSLLYSWSLQASEKIVIDYYICEIHYYICIRSLFHDFSFKNKIFPHKYLYCCV